MLSIELDENPINKGENHSNGFDFKELGLSMHIGETVRFGKKDILPIIVWLIECMMQTPSNPVLKNLFSVFFNLVVLKKPVRKRSFNLARKASSEWMDKQFPNIRNSRGNYFRPWYSPKSAQEKLEAYTIWNEVIDSAVSKSFDVIVGDRFQYFVSRLRRANVDPDEIMATTQYLKLIGCKSIPTGMPTVSNEPKLIVSNGDTSVDSENTIRVFG